jgi:hypothetical protein
MYSLSNNKNISCIISFEQSIIQSGGAAPVVSQAVALVIADEVHISPLIFGPKIKS